LLWLYLTVLVAPKVKVPKPVVEAPEVPVGGKAAVPDILKVAPFDTEKVFAKFPTMAKPPFSSVPVTTDRLSFTLSAASAVPNVTPAVLLMVIAP
jgi:hypothetical protein